MSNMLNTIESIVRITITTVVGIVIAGVILYGGSRVVDKVAGWKPNTSISWIGRHAKAIGNLAKAANHISQAVK